ncbi:MAG: M23 family metallopeptidase [Bacteroidota bacterium]
MRAKHLIFLFIPLLCQSQYSDSLATRFLTLSKGIADVEKLIAIIGEDALDNEQFDYVPTINPLNPKRLKRFSSSFGMRFHPMDKENKQHLGIDISAKAGTPIHAAASGTVKRTEKSDFGYGNQVVIDHRYGFKTRYAHMYLFVVKKGQSINKGDIIGYVGNTGKSTGNHVHYEIWKGGKPIDPYPFCFLHD